jgi:hypothetical protein
VTFANAMTTIGTHLAAAGTAVTPQILDVSRGAPVSVGARMIRYWYAGDAAPTRYQGQRTLTTEMIGRRVTIAVLWPVSDKAVLASLDAEIVAVETEIKTRLLGDSQLGGACDDLDVGYSEVDYPVVNGAQVAELTIPLTLDFGEAYTIAA